MAIFNLQNYPLPPQVSIEEPNHSVDAINDSLLWIWSLDWFKEEFPDFQIEDDIMIISYEPERNLFHIAKNDDTTTVFQSVNEHPTLQWISDNLQLIMERGEANQIKYEGNV